MIENDSNGVLGGIDHVAIAVHDADDAIHNLARTLGYTVCGDEIIDEIGVRLVYLSAGEGQGQRTMLQLLQPTRSGPVAEYLSDHGEGLHHVCFLTDDVERGLLRAGEPNVGGVFLGGRGRRCAFLSTQPHGLRVELTEELPWAR